MKYLTILGLLMLAVSSLGCSALSGDSRTNPVKQTNDKIENATYDTSRLNRVGKDGTLAISGQTSVFSSLLGFDTQQTGVDENGDPIIKLIPRVDSIGNGASHEMLFPIDDQWAALRSATVFTVSVDEWTSSPDGTKTVKGLRIGSDSASANRSVAEVVAALAPVWEKWSADDRARFEAQVKAFSELGIEGMKVVSEALQVVKAFGVAP